MSKSIKIRPKFICQAFTKGSATASMLLEELYYWVNYSDIEQRGDKVVVHSYDDWMRLTGLTLSQFRSALRRLRDCELIWSYNTYSKFHGGKKCIHIAVMTSWHSEYQRLKDERYLQNELYGFNPTDLYESIQTFILEKEAEENQVGEQEFTNQGQALPKDKSLGKNIKENEDKYISVLEEINYKHHDIWLKLFDFYYPEYAGFDLSYKHKKQLDELSKAYDICDKSFSHVMRMIFTHWKQYLGQISKETTVMPLIKDKPSLDFIHEHSSTFLKLALQDLRFSNVKRFKNVHASNKNGEEIKLKAKKKLKDIS